MIIFFSNGKSSVTSKMECSAFLVFDKNLSSLNKFQGDVKVCGQEGYGESLE